jgi:hypothetical protein
MLVDGIGMGSEGDVRSIAYHFDIVPMYIGFTEYGF